MKTHTGACSCGALRVEADGAPDRVGICHCRDCQRHHGALFYAAAIFPAQAVRIIGASKDYEGRHFCPNCGSSVFASSGDEIELHLGVLDAPESLVPDYECWTVRRAAWLPPFKEMASYARDRPDETTKEG